MAKEYVPIFFDWIEVTEELTPQEKGRLIDAIVVYAAGGSWQELITGNERYLFPAFRKQIDRARENSATKAENGAAGGKQKAANSSKTKQTVANCSKIDKENNNNKEKENKKEDAGIHAPATADDGTFPLPFGATLTDEEINASLDRDRQIENACKDWGLPCKPGHMITAQRLAAEYSLDWVLEAIRRAGSGKEQTWRYVEGILRAWKRNGGIDGEHRGSGCEDGGNGGTEYAFLL